jgi:hypothetical protein
MEPSRHRRLRRERSEGLPDGREPGSGGAFFGVRLAATGALQAQTANAYAAQNHIITDLDGDGPQEILFLDDLTGREVCLAYTGPPGPIVPRWTIRPFSGHAPFTMFFADLDGNDHQYLVFRAESASGEYEIYTNHGRAVRAVQPKPSTRLGAGLLPRSGLRQ